MRYFLLALILGALLPGCTAPRTDATPAGSETAPPYSLVRFRDEVKIADGVDTLVIDNPYGEITVRQTSASSIAWEGVEQRIGNAPRQAKIEPFHEGKHQGIRVRYPGLDPNASADPLQGRVDLYIFVPSAHRLDLRSDFGLITVRKLDDDVRARSRTGMIVVASRGSFDLESESGELRAFPMQGLRDAPSRMVTAGNILVDVPVFDDIVVEARSAGEFRSDVPLDSKQTDANGVTFGRFSHGTGKHRLTVDGGLSVILQSLKKPIPGGSDSDD